MAAEKAVDEDEEEQIEQSAAEPGAVSDEEMVEDADEEDQDEAMKDDEEQIEESDEEDAVVGTKAKRPKESQAASRAKRKAGESASLFINVASSILAEDYGQEELGDDEEEGEYEPPSQVSSESFPAASDSNMISEEFQIGEQASAMALAQEADAAEEAVPVQQSQRGRKSASK